MLRKLRRFKIHERIDNVVKDQLGCFIKQEFHETFSLGTIVSFGRQPCREAISNTVTLSKELDRLRYSRIWLSEHHNLNILQGSTPEVLLAAIGAQTTRIRLGSGGVMLPNRGVLSALPRTFARSKLFFRDA